MYFVCVLHVLGYGGVLESASYLSVHYYAAWFLEISAYCAVNCFGLISGFVGISSKYKISRILYLWLHVFFYSFVVTIIFYLVKPSTVSAFWQAFFPVTFNAWWYFTAYFCLFLFSPILKYAIQNIPKTIMNWSILILVVIVSIFSRLNENLFTLSSGYAALWLMLLYLMGGYVKHYQPL